MNRPSSSAVIKVTGVLRGGGLADDTLVVFSSRYGQRDFLDRLLAGGEALVLLGARDEVLCIGQSDPQIPGRVLVHVPFDSRLVHQVDARPALPLFETPGRDCVSVDLDWLRQFLADPFEIAVSTNGNTLRIAPQRQMEPKPLSLSVVLRTRADQSGVNVGLGPDGLPSLTAAIRLRFFVERNEARIEYTGQALLAGAGQGDRAVLHAAGGYTSADVLRALQRPQDYHLAPVTEVPYGLDFTYEYPVCLRSVLGQARPGTKPDRFVISPGSTIRFELPIAELVLGLYRRVGIGPIIGVSLAIRSSACLAQEPGAFAGSVASPTVLVGILSD